jgi:hypothetical protein
MTACPRRRSAHGGNFFEQSTPRMFKQQGQAPVTSTRHEGTDQWVEFSRSAILELTSRSTQQGLRSKCAGRAAITARSRLPIAAIASSLSSTPIPNDFAELKANAAAIHSP